MNLHPIKRWRAWRRLRKLLGLTPDPVLSRPEPLHSQLFRMVDGHERAMKRAFKGIAR